MFFERIHVLSKVFGGRRYVKQLHVQVDQRLSSTGLFVNQVIQLRSLAFPCGIAVLHGGILPVAKVLRIYFQTFARNCLFRLLIFVQLFEHDFLLFFGIGCLCSELESVRVARVETDVLLGDDAVSKGLDFDLDLVHFL